jgi:Tfp pilus assembly ATPase PilU
MQTLDQNLQKLVKEGKVSRAAAKSKAANADSIQ